MRVLFEINHPAQAHLFKFVILELITKGHFVTVLIKENQIIRAVFDDLKINYLSLGTKGHGLISKAFRQLYYTYKIFRLDYKHQYDVAIGVSVSLPIMSKFRHFSSIVLDDDDKKATPLFAFLAHKSASQLLRPAALKHEGFFLNTTYFQGYHELAYLHPGVFAVDKKVLTEHGLSENEPFFILRLVALDAHHDTRIRGISHDQLNTIVALLIKKGRVIITKESPGGLPKGAELLKIKPERIHHLMAFARLVISDGQTMCSEAACLGVPSVRINDFVGRISYLEEQEERWKLTFGFKPEKFSNALRKIEHIIEDETDIYKKQRDKMIAESINVKEFLVWFIENYPESASIMKENPDYQLKFK